MKKVKFEKTRSATIGGKMFAAKLWLETSPLDRGAAAFDQSWKLAAERMESMRELMAKQLPEFESWATSVTVTDDVSEVLHARAQAGELRRRMEFEDWVASLGIADRMKLPAAPDTIQAIVERSENRQRAAAVWEESAPFTGEQRSYLSDRMTQVQSIPKGVSWAGSVCVAEVRDKIAADLERRIKEHNDKIALQCGMTDEQHARYMHDELIKGLKP